MHKYIHILYVSTGCPLSPLTRLRACGEGGRYEKAGYETILICIYAADVHTYVGFCVLDSIGPNR